MTVPAVLDPIGTAELGDSGRPCRYCHTLLTDEQEMAWEICTGCYHDGISEAMATAMSPEDERWFE